MKKKNQPTKKSKTHEKCEFNVNIQCFPNHVLMTEIIRILCSSPLPPQTHTERKRDVWNDIEITSEASVIVEMTDTLSIRFVNFQCDWL